MPEGRQFKSGSRNQNEKNIQASETAGGASLAVDLPECSF